MHREIVELGPEDDDTRRSPVDGNSSQRTLHLLLAEGLQSLAKVTAPDLQSVVAARVAEEAADRGMGRQPDYPVLVSAARRHHALEAQAPGQHCWHVF